MPVRLRFSIHGQRNQRILHLVAVDLRKRRDAKPIETLGIYDPTLRTGETAKSMEWAVDRIRYWLNVGAQPSKSVVRLLTLGNVIPPDSKYHPKATGPPTPPPATSKTASSAARKSPPTPSSPRSST